MANLERCVESNPQAERTNHSALIEDFLNQTFQKDNEPIYRCGGSANVPDVEMFDSEAEQADGNAAVAARNTESFDPEHNGHEFLKANKSPAEIAEKYAKDWQEGHYQFLTPFLNDVHDIARNSADPAAALKKIQDTMNELMKNDPKDTQVALDLRPDNTVLMRFGDHSSFYRHIIDLSVPYRGNRYSYDN